MGTLYINCIRICFNVNKLVFGEECTYIRPAGDLAGC